MRKKLTISVDYEMYDKLKELSIITRIPASRLFDEAVSDLLDKHEFDKLKKNVSGKNK